MKKFEQETKNTKPITYYEIIINDGDFEECESDVCFNKKKDAVSFLKKKADVIFKDCEDINEFDFTKVNMDKINIFIENDGYFCNALYTQIETKKLICEKYKEDALLNNEVLYIVKQSKFFL